MRAGCCVYLEIGLQRSGLVTSAGVQCAANINSDPGLFISGPGWGRIANNKALPVFSIAIFLHPGIIPRIFKI